MIPGWLDAIEDEVAIALAARGRLSACELAQSLAVSEASAVSYFTLLASAGRLSIDAVSLPPGAHQHAEGARVRPAA
ncbi:MAG: hypothetical protein HY002_05560 [Candidatus Rokubacteria bacterium]|nr:hypothetical protein [Candidatus Rokubacteria bacterium]